MIVGGLDCLVSFVCFVVLLLSHPIQNGQATVWFLSCSSLLPIVCVCGDGITAMSALWGERCAQIMCSEYHVSFIPLHDGTSCYPDNRYVNQQIWGQILRLRIDRSECLSPALSEIETTQFYCYAALKIKCVCASNGTCSSIKKHNLQVILHMPGRSLGLRK